MQEMDLSYIMGSQNNVHNILNCLKRTSMPGIEGGISLYRYVEDIRCIQWRVIIPTYFFRIYLVLPLNYQFTQHFSTNHDCRLDVKIILLDGFNPISSPFAKFLLYEYKYNNRMWNTFLWLFKCKSWTI